MKKLENVIHGRWSLPGFPDVVFIGNRVFHRAEWKQTCVGIVEQYREAVDKNSAHLKIRTDGVWFIDHMDDFNPDRGYASEHFLEDTPAGGAVKVAAVSVAAGAAVVLAGELLAAIAEA